jgi:UDP-glucose:(heptosyl)LPS alpha-1,3-glucosyltransferase
MTCPTDIVMVRSTYRPFGGVERVALSLINGLLKKGIKLALLTQPRQDWPISDPGLEIVPLGVSRGHRLFQAWLFNKGVNRYLSRCNGACILSLDKVTRFTHLHAGGGTHRTFLSIKSRYQSRLARLFTKLSLFHHYILYVEKRGFENPNLIKVRCNSTMVMNIIQDEYHVPSEKLVLVHSGIRWQAMQESFQNRENLGRDLLAESHLNPQLHYLLFLGSGFQRKGLDVAIKGLLAMPLEYHLVIVGKGNRGRFLRLAAALGLDSRVHFLGPKPNGWRYASFCNAVVLPSQYDPFGGAAAEGHAMGLPVLVSDQTGYADLVTPAENGIIIETPMTDGRIDHAFRALAQLIEAPVCSPNDLRNHARNVDDDVILEKLLESFLTV